MTDRDPLIRDFLKATGWGIATRIPLAGDASLRRHERFVRGTDRAILMDAPPDSGEDTRPFIEIADWLAGFCTALLAARLCGLFLSSRRAPLYLLQYSSFPLGSRQGGL